VEDGKRDYYQYTLSPTYTFLTSESGQAMAVYGVFALIQDTDDDPWIEEDGTIVGVGCSYTLPLDLMNSLRLSLEWTRTVYDVPVYSYPTPSMSSDDREDKALTGVAEYQYRVNQNVGFYSQVTFIHTSSNITYNNNDRTIVEAGVVFSY
jgi:hypothetical protein